MGHPGDAVTMTELSIIRLPPRLSETTDKSIGAFLEEHAEEEIQSYRRWQGSDLSMIFTTKTVQGYQPAFVTRCVTIGAFSDDPGHIAFVPDIVVTRPEGRYTLPRNSNGSPAHVVRWFICDEDDDEFWHHRVRDKPARDRIVDALTEAWARANELSVSQANDLLP
jgi:hypothetical protein